MCAAFREVADLVATGRYYDETSPRELEVLGRPGDVAQRYPNEAIRYEGALLSAAARSEQSVDLVTYSSKQNIRFACSD